MYTNGWFLIYTLYFALAFTNNPVFDFVKSDSEKINSILRNTLYSKDENRQLEDNILI